MLALRGAYNQQRDQHGVRSENLFGRKGDISPEQNNMGCLLYTSPSPRDRTRSRMPSSEKEQTLTLKDVPNGSNAFWSLIVYDKDGFPVGENYNINSAFAKTNDQG